MLENVNSCTVQFYTPFECRIVCLLKVSEPFGVIFDETSCGENGEHRFGVVNWVNCSTDQAGSAPVRVVSQDDAAGGVDDLGVPVLFR